MKNCLLIIPVICMLALSGCQIEQGAPGIYLDNLKGSDRNKGDIGHPIKSIARLNELLKDKLSDIYLAGGQVFDGTIFLRGKSGSKTDSIILSSWGPGRAFLNGGNREAVVIDSCNFVSVKSIDLAGSGRKTGNTCNGLAFIKTANSSVINVTSHGFQISGVDLFNCREMVVRNVYAHDNGFCGINVMGSERKLSGNVLIKDCRAENNPGDPAITDNHSGNGILVGVSDSVIIDHCTATNNGWDMPRQGNGPVGIWAWESGHVTIQYCISYRNKTSTGGKDGGGFDFDGGMTNSLIQYCLSYENQGAGYGLFQFGGASGWHDNIIRYCISINDATTTGGAGSFFIWNGNKESSQLRNCYIYNNLVYSNSAPVISFEGASNHEGFIFSNNIFIGNKLMNGVNTGSNFLANVWWSTGTGVKIASFNSLEAWARSTGQETLKGKIVGIWSDPLLKGPLNADIIDPYKLNTLSGLTLQESSPLRDKGIAQRTFNGVGPPAFDFFGNPVPQGSAPEPGISEMMDNF